MYANGNGRRGIEDVVASVLPSLVQVSAGSRGVGTGIIWRQDGLIVTNHHVVVRHPVEVNLADGRTLQPRVLVGDQNIDLVVLQVDALDLPAATIGDSRELQVGEMVLALGNPWGRRNVATFGVISSLDTARSGNNGPIDVIRTDARLAPGNSGGPLIDARGAVVGINTLIVGGDQGIALASYEAQKLVSQVMRV